MSAGVPSPPAHRPGDPVTLLVDGHVHLHRCFPLEAFLERARANLSSVGRRLTGSAPWFGVLLFTESAGMDRFGSLARRAGGEWRFGGGWRLEATSEPEALVARSPRDEALVLVAGRQVVTDCRLEVLALGTRSTFRDGEGLHATVERVRSRGALPVLPWGFGKWWGGRRTLVEEAVEAAPAGSLLLGDNGGRPRGAPEPALFQRARAKGIPVLAGSDPLPFPAEIRRVGSYGNLLRTTAFDPHRPVRDVATRLAGVDECLEPFGSRSGLLRFAWTQARLRMPAPPKGLRSAPVDGPC